jgi:NitT/TauT family transport system substrate-binding protein
MTRGIKTATAPRRSLGAWLALGMVGCAALAGLAGFTAQPARAEQVVVSHYAELMYGAPWAVALDQGFFKKHGVDITGILSSDGGGTTIRNMMASDVPYTETALSAALSAIHDGIDLKIVDGAVNTAADLVWVVKPNSPLKSIHDLVGKKIAYTRASSTTQILGLAALQAAGVDPAKVKMLSLGTIGGGLTALDQGAVDAAPELEPTFSRNAAKYRVLFAVSDVLPPITQHVGAVSAKFLKQHPDQVRGIILARRDGVQFMKAHPDQAIAIIAKAYDMPNATIAQAFKRLQAANYWSEGELDYAAMDRSVVGLHVAGVYPDAKVDWSKLVDESALPPDLRSKK